MQTTSAGRHQLRQMKMAATSHGQGSFDAKEKEWIAAQDSLHLQ